MAIRVATLLCDNPCPVFSTDPGPLSILQNDYYKPGLHVFGALIEAAPFYNTLRIKKSSSGIRIYNRGDGSTLTETVDWSLETTYTRKPVVDGSASGPATSLSGFDSTDFTSVLSSGEMNMCISSYLWTHWVGKSRYAFGPRRQIPYFFTNPTNYSGVVTLYEWTDTQSGSSGSGIVTGAVSLATPHAYKGIVPASGRYDFDRWTCFGSGDPSPVDVTYHPFDLTTLTTGQWRDMRGIVFTDWYREPIGIWASNTVEVHYEWELG